MILGVTGTGKSSLINYLFGSDAMKVGSGRPVTGKTGFICETIPSLLKNDVDLNIYDSWGIEADKAEEWEKLIQEKLTASYNFEKIIHSVVYCVSYANDRIQPFEINLLNTMLETGYGITIAFTKADNNAYKEKPEKFRDILFGENGIKPEYQDRCKMVDVSASPTKKLGQSSIDEPFGREDLLKLIEQSVLDNFIKVVLSIWKKWKDDSLQKVGKEEERHKVKINDFYRDVYDAEDFFRRITTTKVKQAKELRDSMARDLKNLIDDVFSNITKSIGSVYQFYMKIAGAMYPVKHIGFKPGSNLKVDLSKSSLSDGSINTEIATIVVKLIPLLGPIHQFFTEKGMLQDELRGILQQNTDAIRKEINSLYSMACLSIYHLVMR